jgi:hypothetical protein
MKYVPPAITKVENIANAFDSSKNAIRFGSVKGEGQIDHQGELTSGPAYRANG